jgi:D-3-phosphoglycerate dehydrogenase
MRVVGNDPLLDAPPSDFPGPLVPLSALLEQSDYVSLHAPLLPTSRNLIGADQLSRMKPTAFLINCARGALVDETALVRALEAHLIAGAALDVRVQEPTPPGDPLVGRQDVLVTPHAAAFTIEAIRDLRALVVEYVREALAGVAA